ncbi:MAG: endonuclease III domain-containing protein [Nitrospirae bacterium]|nr:endonuclease III domain-containing protein [Nitrospirota bacterium]
MKPNIFETLYQRLFAAFGPQHWWPANSPFEVAIGAILTQNTNWSNVEKAIANLKREKAISAKSLHRMQASDLATLIRPAGYFNVKAARLKNFIDFLHAEYQGSMSRMAKESLPAVREKLLSVRGIGPETADSIILYALEKPVFVIDAYTKRILSRHAIIERAESYETYQKLFHSTLRSDVLLFNEYHALIVRLAKDFCKTKPICRGCPLEGI